MPVGAISKDHHEFNSTRTCRIPSVSRSIRAHRQLILNGFEAYKEFSSGIVKRLNNKLDLTLRKEYGFCEL